MDPAPVSFDRIARPYRWLEYLTLGRALERCREHPLAALTSCRRALILGDGDGRFTAQFLRRNPETTADAVDTSAAMLRLLETRCSGEANRLKTHHGDALSFIPAGTYDLIVSHFFLDCLSDAQLQRLAQTLTPALRGVWLVSDFRIPPTSPLRMPAAVFVRLLYLAFRVLTGLRVTHLPDHEHAFARAGLIRTAHHLSLFGLLTSELWRSPDNPSPTPAVESSMPPETSPEDLSPASSEDPIPNPEPIAPALSEPDPGVFHHEVESKSSS